MKRQSCTRYKTRMSGLSLILTGLVASLSTLAAAQGFLQLALPIDYPGAIATECNDFNSLGQGNPVQGMVIGDYTDTSNVVHGFTLSEVNLHGTFLRLDYPGARMSYAWGPQPLQKGRRLLRGFRQ